MERTQNFDISQNLNKVEDSSYPICLEGSPLDKLQDKLGEQWEMSAEYGSTVEEPKNEYINTRVNRVQDYLGKDVDLNSAEQVNEHFGVTDFDISQNLNKVENSPYLICLDGSPLDKLQERFEQQWNFDRQDGDGLDEKNAYINENIQRVQDYLGKDVDLNSAEQVNERLGFDKDSDFDISKNLNSVRDSQYPICVFGGPLDKLQRELGCRPTEGHNLSEEQTNYINENINRIQDYLGKDVDLNNSKQVEERMLGTSAIENPTQNRVAGDNVRDDDTHTESLAENVQTPMKNTMSLANRNSYVSKDTQDRSGQEMALEPGDVRRLQRERADESRIEDGLKEAKQFELDMP